MNNLRYVPNIESDLDPIDLTLNRWQNISVCDDNDWAVSYLNLPLIQGRYIVVEIDYKGSLNCREEENCDWQNECSFPAKEPVLNKSNLACKEKSISTFVCNYAWNEEMPLPTVDFALRNIPKKMIPKKDTDNDINIDTVLERFDSTKNLETLLKKLCIFVNKIMNGKKHENEYDEGEDMQHLLQEYAKTGTISGDCKSASTFLAGLAQNLGLPSRRLSGFVLGDEMRGGHFWSEVYVPTTKRDGIWIPVDAATGVFKTYPENEKGVYHVNSMMPKFEGEKTARLRVNYL